MTNTEKKAQPPDNEDRSGGDVERLEENQPPVPPNWTPEGPPPVAPMGWEPYSPPAGRPAVAPTGWEPYTPPRPAVAPNGWEPYSPPAGRPAVAPTGWEPYSPPPVAPTGWEPYTPPRPAVAPTGWEPYGPPPVAPNGWEPYNPPQRNGGNGGAAAPAPVTAEQGDGWVHNRGITALYSYDSSPGVWAFVHGVGWKRLSPGSDSGHGHLVLLALMARNHRIPVSYHEDALGQIDQLLV
ncbi:hypothetical protein [Amycolatopsis nigrescens]|uniref:hypothetical protein n=1 Tax=Amycolatopsis nigrescens TaxID=381445 RepID=UPI0003A93547|nr:hypothetical protein [Amycolatopsis nigrescens]